MLLSQACRCSESEQNQSASKSARRKANSKSDLYTSETKNNEFDSQSPAGKVASPNGLFPASLYQEVLDAARQRTLGSLTGRLDASGVFTPGSVNSAILTSPIAATTSYYKPLYTQHRQQQVYCTRALAYIAHAFNYSRPRRQQAIKSKVLKRRKEDRSKSEKLLRARPTRKSPLTARHSFHFSLTSRRLGIRHSSLLAHSLRRMALNQKADMGHLHHSRSWPCRGTPVRTRRRKRVTNLRLPTNGNKRNSQPATDLNRNIEL